MYFILQSACAQGAGLATFLAATVLLAATACGPERATPVSVVRDSAEIRVVESRYPAWGDSSHWRISEKPSLEIGRESGDVNYEFAGIAGVVRFSDGSIVAADRGSRELRFFDSTGKFLRRAGKPGTGPGEFQQIFGLYRVSGDTIAVDNMRNSQEVFASDGRYLRTFRIEKPAQLAFVAFIGYFGDGSFLARDYPQPSGPAVETDSTTLVHFNSDGRTSRTVARVPYVVQGATSQNAIAPQIFAPSATIVARGDRFYRAFSNKYEIAVHRRDGVIEKLIRQTAAGVGAPVTSEDMQAYIDAMRGARKNPDGSDITEQQRAAMEAQLQNVTFARNYPLFGRFHVDVDHNVWVLHYNQRPENLRLPFALRPGPRYSVFDSTGKWLGEVDGPPALLVHEIGRNHIIGVSYDTLGVERIRVYDIIK